MRNNTTITATISAIRSQIEGSAISVMPTRERYPSRPAFNAVRMHRVQTFTRFASPFSTITLLCTFGLNERFVRRLEWLTLCPKTVTFPQISHLPLLTAPTLPLPVPAASSHHRRRGTDPNAEPSRRHHDNRLS